MPRTTIDSQVLRWLQVMSCTDKVVVQILQEDRRASRHMATPTTDNLTPRKQQPLSPGSRRRSEILSAVVGGSSSATTAANHGPSSTQHSDTTAAWHFTLRVSQHGKIWTIERSYSQLVALHEGLLREGQRCQQRYRVPALPPSGCTRMQVTFFVCTALSRQGDIPTCSANGAHLGRAKNGCSTDLTGL